VTEHPTAQWTAQQIIDAFPDTETAFMASISARESQEWGSKKYLRRRNHLSNIHTPNE
jgi:hypothetical protein